MNRPVAPSVTVTLSETSSMPARNDGVCGGAGVCGGRCGVFWPGDSAGGCGCCAVTGVCRSSAVAAAATSRPRTADERTSALPAGRDGRATHGKTGLLGGDGNLLGLNQ